MNLDDQFDMCMRGLYDDPSGENSSELFEINNKPYRVIFKDISGYCAPCLYCGQLRCGGCQVPFVNEITVQQIFDKIKLEHNDTLFSQNMQSGKEFQIQVIWH
jgi:hypothetical protein